MMKPDKQLQELHRSLAEVQDRILNGPISGLTEAYQERNELEKQLFDSGASRKEIDETLRTVPIQHDLGAPPKPRGGKKVSNKRAAPWEDYASYSKSGSKGSSKVPYKRCAHSHPLLTLKEGLTIQGGSCYTPQGTYDVEIFLCAGAKLPEYLVPWGTRYVRFPIQDMGVPTDFEAFDRLVSWTLKQIEAGKKVHVGCIGGHGRTGTFLAALVFKATGETDAINWLRKHYCHKAVESKKQVDWLHDRYGIKKAKALKGDYGASTHATSKWDKHKLSELRFGDKKLVDTRASSSDLPLVTAPLPERSVWGKAKLT